MKKPKQVNGPFKEILRLLCINNFHFTSRNFFVHYTYKNVADFSVTFKVSQNICWAKKVQQSCLAGYYLDITRL